MDLTPAQDRCVHCAELGHSDCVRGAYQLGYQAGREGAAQEIADAIEDKGGELRGEPLRSGQVGIEFVCGVESAAEVARKYRKAISLGRSSGGVGDNPEEQRP